MTERIARVVFCACVCVSCMFCLSAMKSIARVIRGAPNDDSAPTLRVFSTRTVTTSTRSCPTYCSDGGVCALEIDGQSATVAA